MNKVRSIRIAAALLASVMLLSSCTPIGKMQQNGWIKKLSDAFPEDTFTFDGHPEQVLTGTDYSVVKVRSELYPDVYISLWKEKGELYTNYLAIAYEEDIYDELYRVLDGRFPCSSYVIRQANQRSYKGYPVFPQQAWWQVHAQGRRYSLPPVPAAAAKTLRWSPNPHRADLFCRRNRQTRYLR